MMILCREMECAVNNDHVFEYSVEKIPDSNNFGLFAVLPNNDISYILTEYSSENMAMDAMCDLITAIADDAKIYILKEEYDYAQRPNVSALNS